MFQEDNGIKSIHFRNGLFPVTSKTPENSFCAQLPDNSGPLSSPGEMFTTPYLDSIEFTA